LDQIIQTTSAKLVVFDPILAFLDSWFQAATDTGIRHAFFPLSRLAQKHQCAILLVRHLTKSGSRRALYRGGGSIGLLAACRSAWLIVEDPENSANRVLAQIKNNVGPPQPSLGYSILAGPEQTPTIAWLPGFRPFEADDLLARLGSSRAFSSPFARASNFLKDFLRDGPKTSREIWTAAGEFDLSKRTLKRAKKKLQIRSQRVRLDERSVSYWLLKDQELPAKFSSSSVVPDLEPWLKSLREKFPLPTPLDDL
jgi:hypothetical protein